jgi:glucosamine--fructose-6-phosphate aminotransferase (isomerizing)
MYTHAGPEIGVASTKGFTTQLATLACLCLGLARAKGTLSADKCRSLQQALAEVPSRMVEILHNSDLVTHASTILAEARDILYIGRGTNHVIALEGALKLKEISYIHAEGYAAGELKHGPIALLDENVPVVAIAPSSNAVQFEKTVSNIQEAIARSAKIILVSDAEGCRKLKDSVLCCIEMPAIDAFSSALLYALPVQLIAYQVAVIKGTDVDQPRNLAKSVTVE